MVVLLLGSNEGNRLQNLLLAKNFLIKNLGKLIKESSIYETEPWKMPDEEIWFFNQAIVLETNINANNILGIIKDYELKHGRSKNRKNKKSYESREIDIDILFYDDKVINTQDLIIPHPLLHTRRFVLTPLVEILPNFIHPILGKDIKTLYYYCKDNTIVKELKEEAESYAIN